MKKFITSSLIAVTALAGLTGSVSSVNASTIPNYNSTSSTRNNVELQELNFSPITLLPWFDKYIGTDNPLYGNNLDANGNPTEKTTQISLHTIDSINATDWLMYENSLSENDEVHGYLDSSEPLLNVTITVPEGYFTKEAVETNGYNLGVYQGVTYPYSYDPVGNIGGR